jgi:hypothetical protein
MSSPALRLAPSCFNTLFFLAEGKVFLSLYEWGLGHCYSTVCPIGLVLGLHAYIGVGWLFALIESSSALVSTVMVVILWNYRVDGVWERLAGSGFYVPSS